MGSTDLVATIDRETNDLVAEYYEPLVLEARARFCGSDVFRRLTSPSSDRQTLDRFLIEFCARGVAMTEPVDTWILRAGARCTGIGLLELGAALRRHAIHEAGHHELMIADTRALVELWNLRYSTHLDASSLLERPPSPGVLEYTTLHEETIDSTAPYGQLAIEYEIEGLSVTAGRALLGNVAAICGADRIAALSFLTDHVAVDQAHTVFNRKQLNQLLDTYPQLAIELGRAGTRALDAYLRFLTDCLSGAES